MNNCKKHSLHLNWGQGIRPLPKVWLPPSETAWKTRDRKQKYVFDFSQRMLTLVGHIAATMPEFAFVKTDVIAVDVTAARQNTKHGLQARLTPMRVNGGGFLRSFQGRPYQLQKFTVEGQDLLYIVSFCMPRFFKQPYCERLATVFHELLHISPAFDGDIRRFGGRYTVHSKSKDNFHGYAEDLAKRYEQANPEPLAFLRMSHEELWYAYGGITALKLPRPKLILLT